MGRLHEVDAFVADFLQSPNVHEVPDAIVRLVGHSEGVLEVTLEALSRSLLHVPDQIGLPVDGGERDHQASIFAHLILQADVSEGNSNSYALIRHGLFKPDGEALSFGRTLEMMGKFRPLVGMGAMCVRGNWQL